jgi:hypothetical protein
MTQTEITFVEPPKAGTQHHKLLTAMQAGVKLTIWNAMVDYGCGALHQRIKELRDIGWPINRREITVNGKRVAEFWMES